MLFLKETTVYIRLPYASYLINYYHQPSKVPLEKKDNPDNLDKTDQKASKVPQERSPDPLDPLDLVLKVIRDKKENLASVLKENPEKR